MRINSILKYFKIQFWIYKFKKLILAQSKKFDETIKKLKIIMTLEFENLKMISILKGGKFKTATLLLVRKGSLGKFFEVSYYQKNFQPPTVHNSEDRGGVKMPYDFFVYICDF